MNQFTDVESIDSGTCKITDSRIVQIKETSTKTQLLLNKKSKWFKV